MTTSRLEMTLEGEGGNAGFLVYSRVKGDAIETVNGNWAGKQVRIDLPVGADNLREIYKAHGKAGAFDALWVVAVLFEELCKRQGNVPISLMVDEVAKNVNHILMEDNKPDLDLETQLKFVLNHGIPAFFVDGESREITWS